MKLNVIYKNAPAQDHSYYSILGIPLDKSYNIQ